MRHRKIVIYKLDELAEILHTHELMQGKSCPEVMHMTVRLEHDDDHTEEFVSLHVLYGEDDE